MPDTRKLRVTKSKVITTGSNDHGDWTLYAVDEVEDEQGQRVGGESAGFEFRSFADLEIGALVEYECEVKHHEKHGKQIFLKPPRKRGAALGPKVDELRSRVETVEADVAWLKEQVGGGGNGGVAPPDKRQSPARSSGGSDDDIPF